MRRLVTVTVLCLAAPLLALTGCGDDDDNNTPSCEPACGPCQTCDTSGDAPACVDNCAGDLECQDGVCTARDTAVQTVCSGGIPLPWTRTVPALPIWMFRATASLSP